MNRRALAAACLLVATATLPIGAADAAPATPPSSPSRHPTAHRTPARPAHNAANRTPASPRATAHRTPGTPKRRPPTATHCPRISRTHLTNAALWPQRVLDFRQVWPVTTGTGVTVAVIDSGLNPTNPQLRTAHILPGIDAMSVQPSSDVSDCVGHGSEVTAVIAAQPSRTSPFLGIAPGVRILPIRQTNTSHKQPHGSSILARAIEEAVNAGAQVANVSLGTSARSPELLRAVRHAARAGMIIVAAAGNKGENGNHPQYPAAYSPRFPTVIAVAASNRNDRVAGFPNSGKYVDIAAPGSDLAVPAPGFGFVSQSGTSFAAPYVTGTVALMLAAHPHLPPDQVRARLEATADQPGVTVPNPRYGYGIVDPYVAVTSVGDDTAPTPSASRRAALPPPAAPVPPSRHLQHVALAVGITLGAVAVLVVVAALVIRSSRAARHTGRPGERGPAT